MSGQRRVAARIEPRAGDDESELRELEDSYAPYPPLRKQKAYKIVSIPTADFVNILTQMNDLMNTLNANPDPAHASRYLNPPGLPVDARPQFLGLIKYMIESVGDRRFDQFALTGPQANVLIRFMAVSLNAILTQRQPAQLKAKISGISKALGFTDDTDPNELVTDVQLDAHVQAATALVRFTKTICNCDDMLAGIAAIVSNAHVNGNGYIGEYVGHLVMLMSDTGLKQYDWIMKFIVEDRHACTRNPDIKSMIMTELRQVAHVVRNYTGPLNQEDKKFFQYVYSKSSRRPYIPKNVAPICTRVAEQIYKSKTGNDYTTIELKGEQEEIAVAALAS